MKRICTSCAAHGKRVEAKYVAMDRSELMWFECEDHGERDNVAETVRWRREPIEDFFRRAGINFAEVEDLEEPPPPTERNPVLEHDT